MSKERKYPEGVNTDSFAYKEYFCDTPVRSEEDGEVPFEDYEPDEE